MNTLTTLPAGWYTDAADPAFLRFWTGTAWSSHRKSRPGLPASFQEEQSRKRFARARRIR
jgi:hypothetical protein